MASAIYIPPVFGSFAAFMPLGTMPLSWQRLEELLTEFFGEDADKQCVPVGTQPCRNLQRGYCNRGTKCPHSHKYQWMRLALQNAFDGVFWAHLGSEKSVIDEVLSDMTSKIGPIKRYDIVEMNGTRGKFYCAVIHCKTIKKDAFQMLASGQCIRFGEVVRMQLFRSIPMTEDEIKAKREADDAVAQLSPMEQDCLLKQHIDGVTTLSPSMHKALVRASA